MPADDRTSGPERAHHTPALPEVEAVQGDLTTLAVDAVVNAANHALAPGGGVCGAIFRAAGSLRLQEACEALGGCSTGDAVATPGFALPARWIVHAVGPVWHGGNSGEDELLASCYRRSLQVAADLGARSLAFPAISTGVYGFPPDRAAAIAVRTVRETPTAVRRVVLVAFDRGTLARYQRLLGEGEGSGAGSGGARSGRVAERPADGVTGPTGGRAGGAGAGGAGAGTPSG